MTGAKRKSSYDLDVLAAADGGFYIRIIERAKEEFMNDNHEQFISEQEDAQALTSDNTPQIQYILDENDELTEISKDKCKPVDFPIKHKLINAFEVFVRVEGTENYWISNYGRCVNNANRKDKDKFFEHKRGNHHYTIFEVDKIIVSYPQKKLKTRVKIDRTKERKEKILSLTLSNDECAEILNEFRNSTNRRAYEIKIEKSRRETSTEELVAQHFLVQNGNKRIWHKDGDEHNNWYKNLIYVSAQQYKDLKSDKMKWQDLNFKQEYIEYENKASYSAYHVYNGIRSRCKGEDNGESYHACYNDTSMCKEWLNNPKSFVKWYLEHYYQCGKESMAVDKDLFGNGSHIYSPENCCILPQGLNALLANCKKHYTERKTSENSLPYGVQYNSKINKYYGRITFSNTGDIINLSYHDTPEEAFAEYKKMKEAYVYLTAARYKDKVPEYIYKKLLTVEVQPY